MTTIGYARVSTESQTLQAQTEALHDAGCARLFAEKISGAYSDRPQLAKAIAALAVGDCLVVCKLDRLARSTRDLLNSLATIGERGAIFKSLGEVGIGPSRKSQVAYRSSFIRSSLGAKTWPPPEWDKA